MVENFIGASLLPILSMNNLIVYFAVWPAVCA